MMDERSFQKVNISSLRLREILEKKGDPIDRLFQVFSPLVVSPATMIAMAEDYAEAIDTSFNQEDVTEEFQRHLRQTFEALIFHIEQQVGKEQLIDKVVCPVHF